MGTDMLKFFADNGTRIIMDANSPVSLVNTEDAWFVAEGRVDLFLVDGQDTPGQTERTRAFSVAAGQVMFGCLVDSGPSLLAVGTPGTVAYRMTRSGLDGLRPDMLAQLVDGYLDNLAQAMTRGIGALPEAETLLKPGESVELAQFSVARADGGTIWIRHITQASALYMGMEDVGDQSDWYPLAPAAWIQAFADVTMECCTTEAMVQDEKFWPSFGLFQGTAFNCLALGAAFATADRLVALREKSAADVRVTRGGLLRLASIMDPSIEAPSAHDSKDALASACSVVARKIGVDIFALKASLSGKTVEEVAASGNMRARHVLLRGQWYKDDGGPLVAFTAGDKHPVALIPTSPKSYALHDPRDDSIRPVTKAVHDELDPVAYTLYRPLPSRTLGMRDIPMFGLRGSWKDLGWVGVLGVILGLTGLITPLLTRIIF